MLPTLFVSHGSPMLAVEPGLTGPALAAWARAHATPRAILVVSPHWQGSGLTVSLRARQEALHDFGGFPPALYALEYSPPGSPELARDVAALLSGLEVYGDPKRPLDHGAWVPLRYMYPDADIPVVQLSLDPHRDAAAQYEIGQRLAAFRQEGVLVLGSGSMTHNLREVFGPPVDAPVVPYVDAFRGWFEERLAERDLDALFDWARRAPNAARAHPTDEHLMPLFVALGAGGWPARRFNDEVTYGALAMDAWEFGGTV